MKNGKFLAGLSTDGFWDIQSFNVIEETLHFYQHSISACKIEMGKSLSHLYVAVIKYPVLWGFRGSWLQF